jgi:hypothetical protein
MKKATPTTVTETVKDGFTFRSYRAEPTVVPHMSRNGNETHRSVSVSLSEFPLQTADITEHHSEYPLNKDGLCKLTLYQLEQKAIASCPQTQIDNRRHQCELARRETISLRNTAKNSPSKRTWAKYHARFNQLLEMGFIAKPLTVEEHSKLNAIGVHAFEVTSQAYHFAKELASLGQRCYLCRHPDRGEYWVFTRPPKYPQYIISEYIPISKGKYSVKDHDNRDFANGDHRSIYTGIFVYNGILTPRLLHIWGIGINADFKETGNSCVSMEPPRTRKGYPYKTITKKVRITTYPELPTVDGKRFVDLTAKPKITYENRTLQVPDYTQEQVIFKDGWNFTHKGRWLVSMDEVPMGKLNGKHFTKLYANNERLALEELKRSCGIDSSNCSNWAVFPVKDSREVFLDELGSGQDKDPFDDEPDIEELLLGYEPEEGYYVPTTTDHS